MARSQRSSIVHVPESRDNSTSPRLHIPAPFLKQYKNKQWEREMGWASVWNLCSIGQFSFSVDGFQVR